MPKAPRWSSSLAVVLPLVVVACSGAPPAPQAVAPPVPASSSAPPPPASSAPPRRTACERAAEATKALSLAIPPEAKTREADVRAELAKLVQDLPKCMPFGEGAWAFVPTSAAFLCGTPSCSPEDIFSDLLVVNVDLVLFDPSGSTLRKSNFSLESGIPMHKTLEAKAFDYDGDGTPEVTILTRARPHEAREEVEGEMLTKKDGEIRRYAPSEDFDFIGMRDVDGDGRDDLDIGSAFEGEITPCGLDGTHITVGPHRFAHSKKDGTFTLEDDVAKAQMRAACPEKPKTLVPRVKGGIDNDKLRMNLLCSSVWGVPAKTLVAELKKSCKPMPKKGDECSFEGVLPGCVNVELLETWAIVDPEVRLDQ